MNIFITGGTGFLGSALILGLLRDNHKLFVLSRQKYTRLDSLQSENISILYGDISTINDVNLNEKIDVCLHFAWAGVNRDGVLDKDIQGKNIEWSMNVLMFAINHGCTCFIDSGSRQEYASTDEVITELTPCMPVSEYGKGKLSFYKKATDICNTFNIQYIHLRIFSVYGIGDHPWSVINGTIDKLTMNQDVRLGLCLHKWSFLYIDDFVFAVLSILNSLNHINDIEIFNVASADIRVLKDLIYVIKNSINTKGRLLFGEFSQNKESSTSLIPDVSKLKINIGWNERTSFDQGIKKIICNRLNV